MGLSLRAKKSCQSISLLNDVCIHVHVACIGPVFNSFMKHEGSRNKMYNFGLTFEVLKHYHL